MTALALLALLAPAARGDLLVQPGTGQAVSYRGLHEGELAGALEGIEASLVLFFPPLNPPGEPNEPNDPPEDDPPNDDGPPEDPPDDPPHHNPEPASLISGAVGGLLCCVSWWRRRRQAQR